MAQQLLSACLQKGIKEVVISPGSRSAPLALSFGSNPDIRTFTIIDERSAAFFALGRALESQNPVALICTSGTALLNYYPAICEAFYSEVPLLVLSADRPAYLIDRGDGQTIRQDQVLAQHCVHSKTLHQNVEHAIKKLASFAPHYLDMDPEQVHQKNADAIEMAIGSWKERKGPVHLNIPLEEPLYSQVSISDAELISAFQPRLAEVNSSEELKVSTEKIELWEKATSKLILVGQMNCAPQNTPAWLNRLIDDPSVIVLTETTSNLNHPDSIDSIDSVIAPVEKTQEAAAIFQDLRPEVLVTLGGHIVSKKIKKFLRDYGPVEHWHIGDSRPLDTFFCLQGHWRISPEDFVEQVYQKGLNATVAFPDSNYIGLWNSLKKNYEINRERYIEQIPYSDFVVFSSLFKAIPEGYDLHLANSSAIRYAQLFPHKYSWKTYCNRGASGIDGSTSTAVGVSYGSPNPGVLVTGDLSFFYDCNAFWNNYANENLKVILINNDGGGIFRILPGKEETPVFEKHFETPHGRTAKLLCEQYELDYKAAKTTNELSEGLKSLFEKPSQAALLEVFTPRKLNDKVLLEYFEFLNLELKFNKTLSHYE
ncbi:2-succinyl-5-enolpyruvyl-6-hydroxy-3-cyclohexene-1-carboxylic-acid synthase [Aureicoccus marinus]|uniref:2-succinyl-5-enolpyruvyl-6-hydroxy-3- cyclohexene-1-carboxylic-acid synthase n=1 Tax=Aureicoccus marinus TaxID=754435 RepID=UPI001FE736BF|nr:2-succinyl-5-enolpyruvyl-6-hydroxy-3-cyclohexene-1-carboxylic-acid synthase [Aureicoccus marinus]